MSRKNKKQESSNKTCYQDVKTWAPSTKRHNEKDAYINS